MGDTARVKRVLLLATTTGYQIRSFGEAAAAQGVRLVIASDRCDRLDDPWWDQAIPVRFSDPNHSRQTIIEALADDPPDGVLAVGDRPTALAAMVAEAFGLPGNPVAAAIASRSKLATRTALRGAGLLTPDFTAIDASADAADVAERVTYPSVIKPLALSGSRGVMRVDDAKGFVLAFERLRRLLRASDIQIERDPIHDRIIIESFVRGREFAVEGVLSQGTWRELAIFDKPDPLDGPFFEETLYITPSRVSTSTQRSIVDAVGVAARALGLTHGPVHAECRVNEQGVYVLEVAPRPIGGLCSQSLRFVSRDGRLMSLEDLLLRHAVGEDVSTCTRETSASGVMMIPIPKAGVLRSVEGLERARAVRGIDDVRITAKPDTVLVPLPEGRSYLGFIFARAERPAAVEDALRGAHARLRFRIDRALPVTGR